MVLCEKKISFKTFRFEMYCRCPAIVLPVAILSVSMPARCTQLANSHPTFSFLHRLAKQAARVGELFGVNRLRNVSQRHRQYDFVFWRFPFGLYVKADIDKLARQRRIKGLLIITDQQRISCLRANPIKTIYCEDICKSLLSIKLGQSPIRLLVVVLQRGHTLCSAIFDPCVDVPVVQQGVRVRTSNEGYTRINIGGTTIWRRPDLSNMAYIGFAKVNHSTKQNLELARATISQF